MATKEMSETNYEQGHACMMIATKYPVWFNAVIRKFLMQAEYEKFNDTLCITFLRFTDKLITKQKETKPELLEDRAMVEVYLQQHNAELLELYKAMEK